MFCQMLFLQVLRIYVVSVFPFVEMMYHIDLCVLNYPCNRTSLVAQMVECLSTMQETWIWSLGREDYLEKKTATHSSILA